MTMSNAETTDTTAPTATTLQTETEASKPVTVKDVLSYLVAQFPLCFSTDQIKPLKVGIFQDLAERMTPDSAISKTQLRQALRVYTSSWRYLEATKEGVVRVDLDGQASEAIDVQQAEHAAAQLAESKQKAAEKRKARIQEQRAKQQAEKPTVAADKKRPNKTAFKNSKPQKATPKAAPAPAKKETTPAAVSLTTLAPSALTVGSKVLVKLGQTPMPATILEANLPDVTVQLGSGMVIKTRQDSLYQA